MSKGEQLIAKFLKEQGFDYETEKTFSDLKHVGKLRFDFWIPAYRTAIEVDGDQHFKETFFCSGKDFLVRQALDQKKDEYCIKTGIQLIRIPYSKLKIINSDFLARKIKKQKFGAVCNLENLISI